MVKTKTGHIKYWQVCGATGTLISTGGDVKRLTVLKNHLAVSKKLHMILLFSRLYLYLCAQQHGWISKIIMLSESQTKKEHIKYDFIYGKFYIMQPDLE